MDFGNGATAGPANTLYFASDVAVGGKLHGLFKRRTLNIEYRTPKRSHRRPTVNMRSHLARWLSQAPPELLAPNLERLEAAFPKPEAPPPQDAFAKIRMGVSDYLQAARERIQFASETDSQCLARLERISVECESADGFPHRAARRMERVCERLAKLGKRARLTQLVSKWLGCDWESDTGLDRWRIGAAIQLSGLLQHRDALSRLLELFDVDWDWWNEEIEKALAAMVDQSVLEDIASQFDELSACSALLHRKWTAARCPARSGVTKLRSAVVWRCTLTLRPISQHGQL